MVFTTQLVQRLLGVGIAVTALPNVVGFQFDTGPDGGDCHITGLQVHAGEQSQATSARLILNSFVEA